MKDYQTEVRKRDNYTCQKCGYKNENTQRTEVHHITPKKEGGKDTPENCVLLCKTCHEYAPDASFIGNYDIIFEDYIESALRPEEDLAQFSANAVERTYSLAEEFDEDPENIPMNKSELFELIETSRERDHKLPKQIIWMMYAAFSYTYTNQQLCKYGKKVIQND